MKKTPKFIRNAVPFLIITLILLFLGSIVSAASSTADMYDDQSEIGSLRIGDVQILWGITEYFFSPCPENGIRPREDADVEVLFPFEFTDLPVITRGEAIDRSTGNSRVQLGSITTSGFVIHFDNGGPAACAPLSEIRGERAWTAVGHIKRK